MLTNVNVLRGFEPITDIFDVCASVGGIIAGGYVRWMCSPNVEPALPGDVDVFPRINGIEKALVSALEAKGYQLMTESETGFELARGSEIRVNVIKSNEVLRTTGDITHILSGFDFTIIQAALLNMTTALVHPDFLVDEGAMLLRSNHVHNPVATLERALKYARKGYAMSASQVVSILDTWFEFSPERRASIADKALGTADATSSNVSYFYEDEDDYDYEDFGGEDDYNYYDGDGNEDIFDDYEQPVDEADEVSDGVRLDEYDGDGESTSEA